ncbi:dihydrofolate reductase [Paenibacillus phyllosphaerae]|uniref:Dihydrofolate reductase n=1 Tax=Paenibacillus phyllosphaerae TaxID=274593 RepID=A0A7W5AWY8_9BACL|nr:dihydrofolate reductase [Paenibacillus phyllosphaerae]MBB3110330.1 dihydrofolate reductase [Paenibacillus phyllosphaerae]
MTITLIAAMESRRGIGLENKLLWHLPAEMAHFKRSTTGKTVLMGRKTFESLGRPLPNRKNVVLSRDESYQPEGCEVIHSIEEALVKYGEGVFGEELMVIGGANIYAQFLPFSHKVLLTEVAAELAADAYFPLIPEGEFTLTERECHQQDEKHSYDFCIQTFERIASDS